MREKPLNPEEAVSEIFALYEKYGDEDYIGEPVSQIEHMSQAAALAATDGYEDEVVLAAFFHDIGHLCADDAESMDGMGNVDHETLGADYLKRLGFSERLSALVNSHVVAKRYLTFKYPKYHQELSNASKLTLKFQGGPMSEKEALAFEANPDAGLIIKMRRWDDAAKETNLPVDNIDELKKMALKHLYMRNKIKEK